MSDQPTSCTQEREARSSRMDSPLGETIVSQLTDVNLTYALPSERWRRSQGSFAKMARGACGSASFEGSDCREHEAHCCPPACADRAGHACLVVPTCCKP